MAEPDTPELALVRLGLEGGSRTREELVEVLQVGRLGEFKVRLEGGLTRWIPPDWVLET
jgi:hypothetical protein